MKYKKPLLRWSKKLWVVFATLFVLFAILFSVFRAMTPLVKHYKTQIEQQLSGLLGQPVSIGDLETGWYWFQPVIKMDNVKFNGTSHQPVVVNQLQVGINLWRSLWRWQVQPGVLYVRETAVTLRQISDSQWTIDGLQANQAVTATDKKAYLPILAWLLSQDTIVLNNVALTVNLQDGSVLPLQHVTLKVKNASGHLRLSGTAQLAQETSTAFSVVADLTVDSENLQTLTGHVYLSTAHFFPKQWQSLLPNLPVKIKQGECDVKLWLDLDQGHLNGVQSVIHLANFSWMEVDQQQKERQLQELSGNFAWKRNADKGWHLVADHLQLRLDDVTWPENAFQLDYTAANDSYTMFVKNILLAPLAKADISWPESVQSLLAKQPNGDLNDTQVIVTNEKVSYVLTRFSDLGWQPAPTVPGVKHLSGVLYWEPTEGHLSLDGENVTISPQKQPALTFNLLNTDLAWKSLSNGYRVSMDRLVLSHPDLVLSANGVLDNPQTPDARIQLSAEFSAKHAKKFVAYLPSQYLKPKLDTWLKHDVKRIANASGRVTLNGKLSDFPFDNQPGEFSVVSHLSGVNLLINDDWPMNRDIDADLVVDKRSLIANIDQANLHGVMIHQINLSIPNIGLGRESLLIHGQVQTSGKQVKGYIFATPLRERLSRWRAIEIDDDVALDLRLDIPLYPENDHIAALGELSLDKNPITIHFPLADIHVDDVHGVLHFNEYGLTDGELRGELGGAPVSLHAQSLIKPKQGTVLSIEAEASADYLEKNFQAPWLKLTSGQLRAAALWTIYANPADPDELHVDSSLAGFGIDLPTPLGKKEPDIAPTTMDVRFDPKQIRLQWDYNHQLRGQIFFAANEDHYRLDRGHIHVGQGKFVNSNNSKGLAITASLPTVDFSDWRDTWQALTTEKHQAQGWDVVQDIDLKIDDLYLLNQKFHQVALKVHPINRDDWALHIEQTDVSGNLHYLLSKHTLSGDFNRVYVKQAYQASTKKYRDTKWTLKPEDIPNLQLSIKDLKVHDVQVGVVQVKSTSTPTLWRLDEAIVAAPEYRFNLSGEWKVLNGPDESSLSANFEMKDLSKSLERWHVKPVVQAHRGHGALKGRWSGAFYDFSLSNLSGDMELVFKNGRISHFDKETEEKLGLGKLLSILSLQTIPRRLQLDFSDLSEDGYSFDIFKGSFQIKQGVMSTHDSYIDGPVAYARMNGDLDLSKHLYDMNLRITPYITASLPIVATIAGGPIAGVATWVASNLINKGMQQISGYTYKISGPWLDPVVQQVSIEKK